MSRGRRGRGRGGRGQGPGQGSYEGAPGGGAAGGPDAGNPGNPGGPGGGNGANGTGGHGGQAPGGGGGGPSGRGILEIDEQRGRGFLRDPKRHFEPQPGDPVIDANTVRRLDLRAGSDIVLESGRVVTVDGLDPEKAKEIRPFKLLTTIDPQERYVLEGPERDISMRVIDLVCPIGRGSRALVVAPPRTGKTILLEKIANRIAAGFPDVELLVLLVNERPEEATQFRRSVTRGGVFYSTVDEPDKRHVHVTEVVGARARRLVELGKDVVLLVDSLTRIGRAFNSVTPGGRTLSGGLDTQAMQRPKAFFGAARNIEGGGSLTIVATALIDTGSRMDEVIFEEFKGTGNLELVLDRDLADRRIFPAINVQSSGTRREERLVSPETLAGMHMLRKVLLRMKPSESTPLLLQKLGATPGNAEFLASFMVGAGAD